MEIQMVKVMKKEMMRSSVKGRMTRMEMEKKREKLMAKGKTMGRPRQMGKTKQRAKVTKRKRATMTEKEKKKGKGMKREKPMMRGKEKARSRWPGWGCRPARKARWCRASSSDLP